MIKFLSVLMLVVVLGGGFVWVNNTYKVTDRLDKTARSWFGDYSDCSICKELIDAEAKKCPNCHEWVSITGE